MIRSLILSLAFTILFELLISCILGIRKLTDYKIIILANICTNPIVVFISNIIKPIGYMLAYCISIIILEIGAIIIETNMYTKYMKNEIDPIKLSICNNCFSFLLGIIFFLFKEVIL